MSAFVVCWLAKTSGELIRRGRLEKVGSDTDSAYYAAFTYTDRDEIETVALGNGMQEVNYLYNERGWLTSINDDPADSGTVPDRFSQWLYYYGFDGSDTTLDGYYNGNIVAQKLKYYGIDTVRNYYEYDDLDRLAESNRGSSAEEFFYDHNGNRDSLRDGSVVFKYGYENGNQLDTIGIGMSQAFNKYDYDANGNVTWVWNWMTDLALGYTYYGQLGKIIDQATSWDQVLYSYSTSGQRIRKWFWHEVDTCMDTVGQQQMMMYIPPGPDSCVPYFESIYTYYVRGQGGQVLAEYTNLYGQPTARYIYAGSQRIAMIDASDNVYYYLNDHLGSAGILMTASGTVRDRCRYQAFGGVGSGQSVNLGQAYRYTGKPIDEEFGLDWYYYGARYYEPMTGRFPWSRPAGEIGP